MITKQSIEERLAQLRAEQVDILAHAQIQLGKIIECENWLASLEDYELQMMKDQDG